MADKKNAAKKTSLDILFPSRKVHLTDGRVVEMRPIPIKDLPELMNSFTLLLSLKTQGLNNIEMLAVGLDSVIELMNHTLVDTSMESMSIADAPFLLDEFIEMNLNETVLGKWQALVSRLGTMFPVLKDAMPRQSE